MKVRSIANNEVTDLPDEQARELVASGIYEEVVADAESAPKTEPKPKTVKTPKEKKKSKPREYKRRDMQAEG